MTPRLSRLAMIPLRQTVRPVDVLGQLDRIVSSSSFRDAARLCRFLRFTVEQTLRNPSKSLKEYVIALEVFDRDDSFDPRTDPIVRVQAGRLRARLKRYYSDEGSNDRIII